MRITISERLKPYSHLPGIFCLLPGTSLRLQVFPTLIRVHDLAGRDPLLKGEVKISVRGPVDDFTVMQDLEKKEVVVWGQTAQGFFRYRIYQRDTLSIFVEKDAQGTCICESSSHEVKLVAEKEQKIAHSLGEVERFSLGVHKAQDWDLVCRRQLFAEIFPFWFHLGRLTPYQKELSSEEWQAFRLEECCQVIASKEREEIIPAFRKLFMAGFHGILSPRLEDDQHQGIEGGAFSPSFTASPLALLTEGARLIRSLFIQEKGEFFDVLPALPPEFHSGRMKELLCVSGLFKLHFEWTKKTIRRMVIFGLKEGKIIPRFQSGLKQFRLRSHQAEQGEFLSCGTPLAIKAGKMYLIDDFRK